MDRAAYVLTSQELTVGGRFTAHPSIHFLCLPNGSVTERSGLRGKPTKAEPDPPKCGK
jgi:hypothetical protein